MFKRDEQQRLRWCPLKESGSELHQEDGVPKASDKDPSKPAKAPSVKVAWSFDGYEGSAKIMKGKQQIGRFDFWSVDKRECNLNYMGIDKAFRGNGYAEPALRAFVKEVQKNGFSSIFAEFTWQAPLYIFRKVLGEPDHLADAVRELSVADTMKRLPAQSPENEQGMIEDADHIDGYWRLKPNW